MARKAIPKLLLLLAAIIFAASLAGAAPVRKPADRSPTATPDSPTANPFTTVEEEKDSTQTGTPTTEQQPDTDSTRTTTTEPASLVGECKKELSPVETQTLLDTFLLKSEWIRENVSSLCNSSSRDESARANFYPCAHCRPFSSRQYRNFEGLALSESIFYFRCYIPFIANQSAIALSEETPRDDRQHPLLQAYSTLDLHREARDLVTGTGGRANACQVSSPAESCPEIPTHPARIGAAMCELKDLTTDLIAAGRALRELLVGRA